MNDTARPRNMISSIPENSPFSSSGILLRLSSSYFDLERINYTAARLGSGASHLVYDEDIPNIEKFQDPGSPIPFV